MHSFISIAAAGLLALPLVAGLPSTTKSLSKRFTGQVTYYNAGLGACGWTNNDSEMIAAISSANFDRENPCGKEISVTGKAGTFTVYLVDRCDGCPENLIDLSPAAFTKIVGPHSIGRDTINWEYTGNVNPDPAPNYPNLDRSGGKKPASGGESKTTVKAPEPTYAAPPQQTTVKEDPVKEDPKDNFVEAPVQAEPTTTKAPEPAVTAEPTAAVEPTTTVAPQTPGNTEDDETKNGNGNGYGQNNGQNGQNGHEGKKFRCKSKGGKGYKNRKRHARK